jgi:hypothetical protein
MASQSSEVEYKHCSGSASHLDQLNVRGDRSWNEWKFVVEKLDQGLRERMAKGIPCPRLVATLVSYRLVFRALSLHHGQKLEPFEAHCTQNLSLSPEKLGELLEKWNAGKMVMDLCRDGLLDEDVRVSMKKEEDSGSDIIWWGYELVYYIESCLSFPEALATVLDRPGSEWLRYP